MRITLSGEASAVDRMFEKVEHALADASVGPLGDGVVAAGEEYLSFARDRFIREGDFEWEDLAAATRDEREYLGYPPAHPILEREGILFRGLVPGAAGNVFAVDRDGCYVGYGGGFEHPGYQAPSGKIVGGGVRLVDIARFHQRGNSKMPARRIIVQPNQSTRERIHGILRRAVVKTIRQVMDVSEAGVQTAVV